MWVKINIYIKILVWGEELVFIVIGWKEDVEMVKCEILLVVEYFFIIWVMCSKVGGLFGVV